MMCAYGFEDDREFVGGNTDSSVANCKMNDAMLTFEVLNLKISENDRKDAKGVSSKP